MATFRRRPRVLAFASLIVVFALAAGVGVLLTPQSASAEPAHGTHIKYYNNAQCDVQVGFEYYDCDGVLQSYWGYTTPYSVSNTYGCIIEF